MVITATDEARMDLSAEGICASVDGQGYDMRIVIHDIMKDMKFKKNISGLRGAECILCKTMQDDWTIREKIVQGFPINRSPSPCTRSWVMRMELLELWVDIRRLVKG